MRVLKLEGRYVCECVFAEKAIPKNAGFRWDPKAKRWYTTDPLVALRLQGVAREFPVENIACDIQNNQDSYSNSFSKDSTLEIPAPQGLAYMPFQKAAIEYASTRSHTLLAQDMGLGKTIISIGYINLHKDIKKILVVCPASLKINWQRELDAWLVKKRDIYIVDSKDDTPPKRQGIIIINYDILEKHKAKLTTMDFDLLIADECHKIKNKKAKRSKAFRAVAKQCKSRLLLTGTPILNRPVELFEILRVLESDLGKDFFYYINRYCAAVKTRFGWDVSGASNLEELQIKLRQSVMVRTLKEDVLQELPRKTRQIIECSAPDGSNAIQQELSLYEEYKSAQKALAIKSKQLSRLPGDAEYEASVVKLREAVNIAFGELARIRHSTAVAKLPFVIEHIKQMLESSIDKIIIFAHHIDVIAALMTEFGDIAVRLTGGDSLDSRQRSVDRFQKESRVKIFIGSIMAAGVGITLTASSNVVFAELDWTPANISQCEDRCHRIGQREAVLIQHIVFDGSLDARMAKMLIEKQKIIDQALNI